MGKEDAVRELLHTVAVAVQRGGALSYLHGYEQALLKMRVARGVVADRDAEERATEVEKLEEEAGKKAASAA